MKPTQALGRSFQWVAGIGPLLFFVIASVEGFLRGGYDPISQPISALALGPRGWIQEVNFLLFAASLFSFAVVLRTELRKGGAAVAGPGLFAFMTVGISLAAVFPMDPPGASPSLDGHLHDVGSFMFFPSIPVALLLAARRFRRDARWQSYFQYTRVTGLYCLAGILFFLLFVGPPSAEPRLASDFRGLVQRLLLLPFLAWMALVARRAYRVPADASAPAGASDASRGWST